ncbi:DUF1810 domain-containing protein [Dyadobacter sp. CY261]|uniref:DUF1810 domain-containing protein n=1 Tax=Dyadobacter sp. CY261 TaxID=2907203 RepID=UPI001F3A0268|nr:DUF1810 domain-containing protein [Dyadobacter sp. CY261]MCF0075495.1 DUF1810 domain-containing protein [Dyadobacter sp. CY261]
MSAMDLQKFLDAQQSDYDAALIEIKNGRKRGHWMWYIFPQIKGLGLSSTANYFAIENLDHARRYLEHPVLGKRLIEISGAMLAVEGKSAYHILGSPDDLKLRSSMTLFSLLPETDPVFQAVLNKYYEGKVDLRTFALVGK